jgi:molecular chaperone DnaK (HSP70)
MPVVQRFITDVVGTPASTEVDPMTAIAEGAAIAAGVLQGTITDLDFHVGTEHALGTIVHHETSPKNGEFSVLIRRNTKYPARATDTYVPATDFQESVQVEVIEGDPAKPIEHEDNVVLKQWAIKLPEPRPRAEAAFDITYEYDVDGILHVRAQDNRTGTLLMDEEVAFGAAEDRAQLPGMRRRVDTLMDGEVAVPAQPPAPEPTSALSPAAAAAVKKATDKVMPFVPDTDRQRLERLIGELTAVPPTDEAPHLEALERELRNHAYLL